jgi:tRNA nucleotidyltransferase (CCA-adding enzyme)
VSEIETVRLSPPDAVREIARRLENAGHETWLVGGAVRDALLGQPDLDWDLATAARPDDVRRLFRRTVPIGIEHGTIGVLDETGRMHEVTTFRRDVETDGRHAKVAFSDSIDEDLARRDFTINAIAWSPSRGELHDPFGGRADLAARLVRAVGEPEERMREDRLRALRAIRFAARFDFEIETATWRAIAASAPQLGLLSAERVRQELEKTMEQVARPARALRLWKESGALAELIPMLAGISPLVVRALDFLPKPGMPGRPQRKINRLASLFFGLDARQADRTLRALRFSNTERAWIASLVERWERIGGEIERALAQGEPLDDARIRRWTATAGRTRIGPILRIATALIAAKCEAGLLPDRARRMHGLYRRALRIAYRDPIEMADLAVNGDDLRGELGIAGGPMLGRILAELLDAVIADPSLNTYDRLVALARDLMKRLESNNEES